MLFGTVSLDSELCKLGRTFLQNLVEIHTNFLTKTILLVMKICSTIYNHSPHCWLEHVRNSKKMLAQAKHIFDTDEYF